MDASHVEIVSHLRSMNVAVDDKTEKAIDRLANNGLLTLGWPSRECSSLKDTLFWFPGLANRPDQFRTTAIVSSRLGREVDRLDSFFFVLRTAVSQLNPHRQRIVSSVRTTTHEYVRRCAELFGVPLVQVVTPTPSATIHRWANECWKAYAANEEYTCPADIQFCFVSNPVTMKEDDSLSRAPLRDAVEILASDQLLVLHARSGGNLSRLVDFRVSDALSTGRPSRVYLALGNELLVPSQVAKPLMDKGAIGWLARTENNAGSEISACPLEGASNEYVPAPILDKLENQDQYFIHCTRRAKRNWPDQSETDFLDELILGEPTRDRSCFAALSRIARMQRLLATNESIRDATPAVSFTALQLDELASARTFRAHRGRWDFEPYGVAIDRAWLIGCGAREVIYGEDADWDAMSANERPFFQKVSREEGAIDWSAEREWRVCGDVDLADVPEEKAALFVPSQHEAESLARMSKWPVVVVGA